MLGSLVSRGAPATIGILGGGQLAKMLAQSAYRLGLRVAVIEHGEDSPAGMMTKHEFSRGWNDADELEQFIECSDIITLENEFIDPAILDTIAERRPVFPSPATMRLVQDKLIQKETMQRAGIPVPRFCAVHTETDAYTFAESVGYPIVIKTRKFGYDGYGNMTATRKNEAYRAWMRWGAYEGNDPDYIRPIMAEEFVSFSAEVAVMVARNRRGEIAVYPCVETIQRDHICHTVIAPARCSVALRKQAEDIAVAAVEAVNGVGVFGVELFLRTDNTFVYNEIAPRPHNSGHYTIEACHTSQFENALRAVLNMPLGSSALRTNHAVMMNILGERGGSGVPDSVVAMMQSPHAQLHLYGKKDSRKGRKMGHLTVVGHDLNITLAEAQKALDAFAW